MSDTTFKSRCLKKLSKQCSTSQRSIDIMPDHSEASKEASCKGCSNQGRQPAPSETAAGRFRAAAAAATASCCACAGAAAPSSLAHLAAAARPAAKSCVWELWSLLTELRIHQGSRLKSMLSMKSSV